MFLLDYLLIILLYMLAKIEWDFFRENLFVCVWWYTVTLFRFLEFDFSQVFIQEDGGLMGGVTLI